MTTTAILDQLIPLLVQAYEHPETLPPVDVRRPAPGSVTGDPVRGKIRLLVRQAIDAGCTPRQIAMHARVPGPQVLQWIDDPDELVAGWRAEIHHLRRQLDYAEQCAAEHQGWTGGDPNRGHRALLADVRTAAADRDAYPTVVQRAFDAGVDRTQLAAAAGLSRDGLYKLVRRNAG